MERREFLAAAALLPVVTSGNELARYPRPFNRKKVREMAELESAAALTPAHSMEKAKIGVCFRDQEEATCYHSNDLFGCLVQANGFAAMKSLHITGVFVAELESYFGKFVIDHLQHPNPYLRPSSIWNFLIIDPTGSEWVLDNTSIEQMVCHFNNGKMCIHNMDLTAETATKL